MIDDSGLGRGVQLHPGQQAVRQCQNPKVGNDQRVNPAVSGAL